MKRQTPQKKLTVGELLFTFLSGISLLVLTSFGLLAIPEQMKSVVDNVHPKYYWAALALLLFIVGISLLYRGHWGEWRNVFRK